MAWEERIDMRVIHDRDTTFAEAVGERFRREDRGPVLTPHRASIANCLAESWIGGLRRECLNRCFCFSLRRFDHTERTV